MSPKAPPRSPDAATLEKLREDFEALYARMQTAEAREATERLLRISDEELNAVVAPAEAPNPPLRSTENRSG